MKAAGIGRPTQRLFEVSDEFRKELQKAGGGLRGFLRCAVLAASPSGRSFTTPLATSCKSRRKKKQISSDQSEMEFCPATEALRGFRKEIPTKRAALVRSQPVGEPPPEQRQYDKVDGTLQPEYPTGTQEHFQPGHAVLLLRQPRLLRGTPAENEKQVALASSMLQGNRIDGADPRGECSRRMKDCKSGKPHLGSDAGSYAGIRGPSIGEDPLHGRG